MIVQIEVVMKGRAMKAALRKADQAGADKALSSYSASATIMLSKGQALPYLEWFVYEIPKRSTPLSLHA